jgi:hypothetical protein
MNVVGNADDELIQLYIDAAEAWFENYSGIKLASLDQVPGDIRKAICDLTAFYYMHREAVSFGDAMRLAPHGVMDAARNARERWFGEDAA